MKEGSYYPTLMKNDGLADLISTLQNNMTYVDNEDKYYLRSMVSNFVDEMAEKFIEQEDGIIGNEEGCKFKNLQNSFLDHMFDFKNNIDLEMEISYNDIVEYLDNWLKQYEDIGGRVKPFKKERANG